MKPYIATFSASNGASIRVLFNSDSGTAFDALETALPTVRKYNCTSLTAIDAVDMSGIPRYMSDGDTFPVGPLRVRVNHENDEDAGTPWDNSDCHGPVSDWTHKENKRPGQRVLSEDRRSVRFYDMEEANKKAKMDGWGLSDKAMAELTLKLKRAPTAGEIRAQAVENDFDYLSRWCHDQWRYIGVIITALGDDDSDEDLDDEVETDYTHALWGVEDDNDDYIVQVARDLALSALTEYLEKQNAIAFEAAERAYFESRDIATKNA